VVDHKIGIMVMKKDWHLICFGPQITRRRLGLLQGLDGGLDGFGGRVPGINWINNIGPEKYRPNYIRVNIYKLISVA
jgi:hypothetical protein